MKVLHVVATGLRRGAELFASDLAAALPTWVEQRFTVLHPPIVGDLFGGQLVNVVGSRSALPFVNLDARAVRRLRSQVARWVPDVVHAHGGEAFKCVAMATLGASVPVLYRKIGSAPPWIQSGPRLEAHRRLIRRADLIVAVAESVRREVISLFRVDADDVVVVPRGVDPARTLPSRDRDEVRRELGIDPGAFVVLSVGALNWEKDPMTHLQITLPAVRAGEVVHVFAGDGPLREELRTVVAAEGVGEGVRILGSRNDVGDLLGAGDAVLLASRTEGMPGCLIEAGMAGVPSVAFNVAGVTEVVEDRSTGFVRLPGDLEGMREAIQDLRTDPINAAAMGELAQERCRRFDIRVVAREYEDLYLRLSEQKRPRAVGPRWGTG
jgi:glycosyltransferase involved in cell wall biosynthesis